MTDNRLLKLLRKLRRKEMTRFLELLYSPYFNKHKDVKSLVSYLSGIYPEFGNGYCNRNTINQKVFPGKKSAQAHLAVVFTYTFRLLKKFLILEQAKSENIFEENHFFLRALRTKEALKLFSFFYQEVSDGETINPDKQGDFFKASVDSRPFDSAHFEKQFKRLAELDAHATILGMHQLNLLSEKQTWLDAFYLSEKLRDACELLQRSRVMKVEFAEDPMLEKVLQVVEHDKSIYSRYPSVLIYTHIYHMFRAGNATLYLPTLKVVEANELLLPKQEVQSIYNHLQNFCIAQINRGKQDFLQELFSLYRTQLFKELLLVDGKLPEWHYKNIVTAGLRLEEFEWVRSFLEKYRVYLNDEVAENAYCYNLAAWHYHQHQYPQVLDLLLKIEYTDLRYNLDAKSMLLRTYYDLGEEEALLALCEAFKQFIKRHRKLSDFQKKGYFNLLKFSRRAFKLKSSKGYAAPVKWQHDFEKLSVEIAEAETVFNKTWLEDKMTGLNAGQSS